MHRARVRDAVVAAGWAHSGHAGRRRPGRAVGVDPRTGAWSLSESLPGHVGAGPAGGGGRRRRLPCSPPTGTASSSRGTSPTSRLRHDVPGSRGPLGRPPDRGGRPRPPGRRTDPHPSSVPDEDSLGHPAAGHRRRRRRLPRPAHRPGRRRGRRWADGVRRLVFGSSVAVSPDRADGRGHHAPRGDRTGRPDA